MTEDNAALTATIKAGAGYDAPWIVIRANTPDELAQRLNAVTNGLVSGPLVAAAQVLQGEWGGQQGGGQTNPGSQNFGGQNQGSSNGFAGQGNGGYNGNPGANQGGGAPGGQTRNCAHGQMQWKAGTSKASGKDYAGWFCTSRDRNNQCPPVWPDK